MLYWRLHGNRSHYARYSDDELRELRRRLTVAGDVDAYVLFNNNNRSRVGGREVAQAPTNAEGLRDALAKSSVPVSR